MSCYNFHVYIHLWIRYRGVIVIILKSTAMCKKFSVHVQLNEILILCNEIPIVCNVPHRSELLWVAYKGSITVA